MTRVCAYRPTTFDIITWQFACASTLMIGDKKLQSAFEEECTKIMTSDNVLTRARESIQATISEKLSLGLYDTEQGVSLPVDL